MKANEKDQEKEKTIDTYKDFDDAILEIHRNIDQLHNPYLEVSDKFFLALTRGKDLKSITYGNPGVRIYKIGTKAEIDKEESLSAEQYRDLEIKRAQEARAR